MEAAAVPGTAEQAALSGLRVVEIAGGLAPAYVGNLLADFGAEVALVEPPGGARLRESAAFPFLARGKKSIVLDAATSAGRDELHRLLSAADVLVEALQPDEADRFAISRESLRAANPQLIHASITAFGRTGPYAGLPVHEGLVMARIGGLSAFSRMVTRDGPAHIAVPFGEFSAAQAALQGILAGLLERERSGRGQDVETSLLRGIVSLDVWNWFLNLLTTRYADAFTPAPHIENGIPNSALVYRLLIALSKDGEWLQFSQTSRHLFVALMNVLGFGWMFDDPVWSEIPLVEDQQRRVELWDKMLTEVRARTAAEWAEVFDEFPNVWAERFRHGPQLLDHPQMVHDGNVVEVRDAERGPVRQPGALARFSGTPARVDHPAPLLDADAAELRAWPTGGPATTDATKTPDPGTPDTPGGEPPLAGVTVLELGLYFAAPFAGALLADLGARVIKVEPIEGDPLRELASFPEIGAIKAMQGKESIALDLSTAEGQRIVHQLAAQSDLVIQSFRAGAAERLNIDAATLRSVSPDLVYLHAQGYGVDGPCGHRPAYAPTIAAATGIAWRLAGATIPEDAGELSISQEKDAATRLIAATNTAFAQCDGLSALAVTTASLLGLVARQRGAGAQDLFTSMLLTGSHVNCEDVVSYLGRPVTPVPDADLYGIGAQYRIYRAADGWVFLAVPGGSEWTALLAQPDFQYLAPDSRFSTPGDRRNHDAELVKELATVFSRRAAPEWERLLTTAGIGCLAVHQGPVEAVVSSDEFGRAAGLVADVEHPMLGDHPRLAPVVSFSRSSTTPRGGITCGQHTRSVLTQLGYDKAAVEDLVQRGVAGTPD
jgi:crotonobetainyl-CoA:carnitine CoA-transferase CaiB-like acyl-CoA transferase